VWIVSVDSDSTAAGKKKKVRAEDAVCWASSSKEKQKRITATVRLYKNLRHLLMMLLADMENTEKKILVRRRVWNT
jgi:hypothetical protein